MTTRVGRAAVARQRSGRIAVALVLLAPLPSCTERMDASRAEPSASSSGVAVARIERLCASVADAYADAVEARTAEELRGALSRVAATEHELVDGLRDLRGSLETDEDLDIYIDRLEAYSQTQELAAKSARRARQLERAVDAAEASVELEEAARGARLPEACPPPPTVDVDNTLFVAQATFSASRSHEKSR